MEAIINGQSFSLPGIIYHCSKVLPLTRKASKKIYKVCCGNGECQQFRRLLPKYKNKMQIIFVVIN